MFGILAQAAGGADKVMAFCEAIAPSPGAGLPPDKDPKHPTPGQPSTPPGGPHGGEPAKRSAAEQTPGLP